VREGKGDWEGEMGRGEEINKGVGESEREREEGA
jgi:hypothetical protein